MREAWVEGYMEPANARREIDAARAELSMMDTDLPLVTGEQFRTAAGLWPGPAATERRDTVRLFFAEIEVDLGGAGIVKFTVHPEVEPHFVAVADHGGPVELCDWWAGRDSNPRATG